MSTDRFRPDRNVKTRFITMNTLQDSWNAEIVWGLRSCRFILKSPIWIICRLLLCSITSQCPLGWSTAAASSGVELWQKQRATTGLLTMEATAWMLQSSQTKTGQLFIIYSTEGFSLGPSDFARVKLYTAVCWAPPQDGDTFCNSWFRQLEASSEEKAKDGSSRRWVLVNNGR